MHDGTTTGGFEVLKARLTYVNSNFNARTNIKYLADTSGSSFTLTLPTLHNKGDIVQIFDSESFWSINNLIVITQNDEVIKDIEGYEDQTLVCDVSGISIELIWEGNYWRLFQ
jgi:hypothetical protein